MRSLDYTPASLVSSIALELALLITFNVPLLENRIRRVVNSRR